MMQEKKSSRLLSLDVFRGMTVAGMILVNLPGNQFVYPLISHSIWNGCQIADLVFPFFIYIVGISLVLSLSKQLNDGVSLNRLFVHILIRTVIIFLLGLFLNAFPHHFNVDTIRIYGVLQRIALCYFFASCAFLMCKPRSQVFILIGLLIGYWLLMTFIPVELYGENNLSPEGNVAAAIDRLMIGPAHLYSSAYDPEGLLSTLPAIATALLGNITGIWLLSTQDNQRKLRGMIFFGLIAAGLGWLWGLWFPINKALWTSSYVLWTGGLALNCFALCYWLIEIKHWRYWSKPFEIFGMNALLAYVLHIFCLKVQLMIQLPRMDGSPGNLRSYITEHFFGWASLPSASLLYALSSVFFWLVVLTFFYKKRIIIRI